MDIENCSDGSFLKKIYTDLKGIVRPNYVDILMKANKRMIFAGIPEGGRIPENTSMESKGRNLWYHSDNPESYERFKRYCIKHNVLNHYETNPIVYTHDADGFRIYPDIHNDPQKPSIFFFGCSHMHGTGLLDSETLPHIMHNKLNGAYNIKNFGIGGSSNEEHTRLMYLALHFIPEKPRAIVWRMTHKYRREYFTIDEKGTLSQHRMRIRSTSKTDPAMHAAYTKLIYEENDIINVIRNYKFAETLCKLYNVPLFWWYAYGNERMFLHARPRPSYQVDKNFEDKSQIVDMSFIGEFFDISKTFLSPIPENLLNFPRARDGKHGGYKSQFWVADKLLDLFKDNNL